MAEGLLRRLFAQAGVGASVGSAGLLPGGSPATPDAIATMAEQFMHDAAPAKKDDNGKKDEKASTALVPTT